MTTKIKKLRDLFSESEQIRFRRVLETVQFFCCRERACYAYEEARRVKIFRSILSKESKEKLGQVLSDSADDYNALTNVEDEECSKLTRLCSSLNALGTRCFMSREPKLIVSLIESSKVGDFIQSLEKETRALRSIDSYEFPSRVPQLSLLKDGNSSSSSSSK